MKNKEIMSWSNIADRAKVLQVLHKGQVIAGSSDTVPGLLSAVSQAGIATLDKIKQRENKPYIMLVKNRQQAEQYAEQPLAPWVKKLMTHFWPGPLTLIIKASPSLPVWLGTHQGTLAVRVPHHAGLQALLEECDALYSTSANLSGQPVPKTVAEIDDAIKDQVAFLIHDTSHVDKKPSTIVDCTGTAPTIIREGAIPESAIKRIMKG
jgi:L-threonylcarbamoyladenylate synthase